MAQTIRTAALCSVFLTITPAALAAEQTPAHTSPLGGLVETVSQGLIKTNTDYTDLMLNRQDHVTDKPLQILLHRRDGRLEDGSVYLGGRLQASQIFEGTNTSGKFPIISRLPGQHTKKKQDSYGIINIGELAITATPLTWLSLFVQGEYTEVEYPGQHDKQIRKYSLLLGDLSRAPVYASFGRNTVAFGNFASYAPITHSHSAHYFWAQSDDPHLELGYYKDGLHVAASLIQSNRGRRVLNTPDNRGWDNFALSADYAYDYSDALHLQGGGGFLRGTIYDSTLAHHTPTWNGGDNRFNGAWNAHGTVSYKSVDLNAEYTRTLHDWPATNFPVSAYTLQGRQHHHLLGKNATASLMYSHGQQGEDGTEWEFMDQSIAGYEWEIHPNLKVAAEYMVNRGFVPLIMPTFIGDRSVKSQSFILGATLTF